MRSARLALGQSGSLSTRPGGGAPQTAPLTHKGGAELSCPATKRGAECRAVEPKARWADRAARLRCHVVRRRRASRTSRVGAQRSAAVGRGALQCQAVSQCGRHPSIWDGCSGSALGVVKAMAAPRHRGVRPVFRVF
eukprot:364939-Chlamydomonas_euryale.AAC.2